MNENKQRQRIYAVGQGALAAPDRLALCGMLVKAGYTVRCGRESTGTSGRKKYVYFVEFWEEKDG